MAIQRRPGPPQAALMPKRATTLYRVELSAAPSAAWRRLFLHPPAALHRKRYTPELGHLELAGTRVSFQTTPQRLHMWLRLIDVWIQYALLSFFERWYAPDVFVTESSPPYPEWLRWTGWGLFSGAAVLYIGIDLMAWWRSRG